MEEIPAHDNAAPPSVEKKEIAEVITIRTWKEYLGESLLIIFSVVLAIILTELINKLHEQHQTKTVLNQLRQELVSNLESEKIQYQYHLEVISKIDSALRDAGFRKRFMDSGRVHLSVIASQGILRKDLNDIAWQVAKQNNIFSQIGLETYSLLTDIYDNQARISKSEDEIGKLLLSYESRKPENLVPTLILIRDNLSAWSVDRAPVLMEKYGRAIQDLSRIE